MGQGKGIWIRSTIYAEGVVSLREGAKSIGGGFFNSKNSFFGHAACEVLVPQPKIEPAPPALEAWSLNHWATRETPMGHFYGSTTLPNLSAHVEGRVTPSGEAEEAN